MKLCTDCRHLSGMRCKAPKNMRVNPYNGELEPKGVFGTFASVHRGAQGWLYIRVFNFCGEKGRWWEPRGDTNAHKP
jgi:hypothetical protein